MESRVSQFRETVNVLPGFVECFNLSTDSTVTVIHRAANGVDHSLTAG